MMFIILSLFTWAAEPNPTTWDCNKFTDRDTCEKVKKIMRDYKPAHQKSGDIEMADVGRPGVINAYDICDIYPNHPTCTKNAVGKTNNTDFKQ